MSNDEPEEGEVGHHCWWDSDVGIWRWAAWCGGTTTVGTSPDRLRGRLDPQEWLNLTALQRTNTSPRTRITPPWAAPAIDGQP